MVQRASKYSRDEKPSTIYSALRKVLDNYKELRANSDMKEYQYVREYKLPKDSNYDLTDVADHLKRTGMPKQFIEHFFHVEEGDLIVRPVVTQADINKGHLDIQAMEKYVWSLKEFADMPNFVSKKKLAGTLTASLLYLRNIKSIEINFL